MALPRRKRNELLAKQHDCCNLCNYHFGRELQSCYHEDTNTLLCRSCLIFLTFMYKYVKKGADLNKAVNYDRDNRIPA